MGMRAHIQPISADSYEAALRGDLDNFVPAEDVEGTDLDKAWHAIHYLLTGSSELRFLLTGQTVEGYDEEIEVHSPQDVAKLDALLTSKTTDELLRSFDANAFNDLGIYPDGWEDTASEYVIEWLERFRLVVRRAVEIRGGITVTLV